MSGKLKLLVFISLIFVLLTTCVFGAENAYINISISEKAYQNVTFAEFFDLNETVTNQVVYGYINVTNPSFGGNAETISDINIFLDNMTYLATNISWMAGRYGNQTVFTSTTNTSQTYINLNVTPIPLAGGQDLDHDNRTDYVWLNETHIIFDFSTEMTHNAYRISMVGGTSLDQLPTGFPISLNRPIILSNGDVAGHVVISTVSGYMRIPTLDIYQSQNDFVVLHIPELQAGESTMFNYTALAVIDPPLDLDTNYTHEQYTKVLSGECFNVTQWATNNFFYEYNLTEVNITMEAWNVSWNTSVFNFTLGNLTDTGDGRNVNRVDNQSWYWIVNDSVMEHDETYNISYEVCAPASVPFSSSYIWVKETLQYRTFGTVSGIEVKDVKAVAKLAFNFTKRIARPQDIDNNTNVTWEVYPQIGTSRNVTYNVTKVSLWVSETTDPNSMVELKSRYYPASLVNLSQGWRASTPWLFNYTDGSEANSPPPIIWMYPYFHVADEENQIDRHYFTENGEDLYWKYIYVVNGYWLEIEKNVTNVLSDMYQIDIRVWNRGNGYTPFNLTVTIYDFVPGEFASYNFTPTWSQEQSVNGGFNGTAYRWDVSPARTPQNASFAPRGMDNSTWNASYYVNGSGDYRVSELFIVGLDPRLVDGGSAHEVISVVSSMTTHTTEMVYVVIVLFLVGLNVSNFVITKNNKKSN